MSLVNPSTVELLMHCHFISEQHPRIDAPAIQDGIKYLLHNGLIRELDTPDDQYTTTEKGKFHVQALVDIPLPVERTIYETPES